MSTVRAVALGVVVVTGFAAGARADKVTVTSGVGSWTFYISGADANQMSSDLRNYFQPPSPPATPTPAPPPTPAPAPVVNTPSQPASSAAPVLAPVTSAPVSAPLMTQSSTSAPSGQPADAYINFNANNLPEASQLAVGTAQPWYTSPAVLKAYGGNTPTPDQQNQFEQMVKSDVQQTYALAGMHPTITLDPNAQANHTISVASGLSYGPNANAIGITDVGHNGFGFIDKLNYANDPTSLAWAVAHNVSHELMHAFGLSYHPDQTGTYIDAATATWDLLTNPNTTFSPGAVQALTNPTVSDLGVYGAPPSSNTQVLKVDGDLEIINTPEPATIAGWAVVLAGAALYRRRKARAAA